jgi:hypothetical protein
MRGGRERHGRHRAQAPALSRPRACASVAPSGSSQSISAAWFEGIDQALGVARRAEREIEPVVEVLPREQLVGGKSCAEHVAEPVAYELAAFSKKRTGFSGSVTASAGGGQVVESRHERCERGGEQGRGTPGLVPPAILAARRRGPPRCPRTPARPDRRPSQEPTRRRAPAASRTRCADSRLRSRTCRPHVRQ